MPMRNDNSRRQLSPKQDELDQANAREIKQVRDEVSEIKRAYIKKHGVPKRKSSLPLKGIASPDTKQASD